MPFVLGVASVRAATLIVTNTADSGAGSLRDTIAAAATGDTIQFAAALKGQTIILTTVHLFIDKDLIIDGPGANQLTVARSTAGGTPNLRIFRVAPLHTVTIQGLTISSGVAITGSVGGGIYNDGSTLTINNCVISGNSAAFGGGIFSKVSTGGDDAQLTINNSTISGNTASQSGGAIYNSGLGSFNFASVLIIDSTISDNSAAHGAGIYNDGWNSGNAFLDILNSTISGNSASQDGGGIYNSGWAAQSALLFVRNSTISGNSASAGGGIFDNGHPSISFESQIRNCTISNNSAGEGGGIDCTAESFNATPLFIWNTILRTGASGENIRGNSSNIFSSGYNLSNDSGSGFLTAVGDYINTDPMLGPLQANGGPTFTHELLMGSPALNAGDPGFAPPPDFDQRGSGFPRVFNTRIDIGAFELQAFAPIPTPSPTPTASPSPTANSYSVAAT